MSARKKIFMIATVVMTVAVLLLAVWIMARGAGLSESHDFGAGAYYYADIPNFDKIINDEAYQAKLPFWVYVALFLGWGFLMYRLWSWIDKK